MQKNAKAKEGWFGSKSGARKSPEGGGGKGEKPGAARNQGDSPHAGGGDGQRNDDEEDDDEEEDDMKARISKLKGAASAKILYRSKAERKAALKEALAAGGGGLDLYDIGGRKVRPGAWGPGKPVATLKTIDRYTSRKVLLPNDVPSLIDKFKEVQTARKVENMKSERMTSTAEGSCMGGMYVEQVLQSEVEDLKSQLRDMMGIEEQAGKHATWIRMLSQQPDNPMYVEAQEELEACTQKLQAMEDRLSQLTTSIKVDTGETLELPRSRIRFAKNILCARYGFFGNMADVTEAFIREWKRVEKRGLESSESQVDRWTVSPEGLRVSHIMTTEMCKQISVQKGSAFVLTLYDSGSGKRRSKRDLGLVWTPKNLAVVNAKDARHSSGFTVDVNAAGGHARRDAGGGGGALGGREEGGGAKGGREGVSIGTLFGELEELLGWEWGGFFDRRKGKVLPVVL